jgi:hypothetical protein
MERTVPTDLPDMAARIRRRRRERLTIIAHATIAILALLLLTWNLVALQAELRAFGWSTPNPYQGRYIPPEFGRRPGW